MTNENPLLKLALASVLFAWTPSAVAAVGPPGGGYRLEDLFTASDAVCVGTVVAIHSLPPSSQVPPLTAALVHVMFGLSPARCYKGHVGPGDVIEFDTHQPARSLDDMAISRGDYALYFLKSTGAGKFTFADRIWGRLHDATLPLLAAPERSGLAQLEADILLNLRAIVAPRALSEELRVLQGFDRLAPATVSAVRPYSKDLDRRVALAAFSVLVRAGSPDDLMALCQYARDPVVDSIAADYGFSVGQIRDPATRQALECLAETPVRALKYGAMDALRAIGSPASVPELIRRLDDPDSYIQFLAYRTLTEIVHRKGEPGEGHAGFARDRDRIVGSWKQWWDETGRTAYPER